jgi:hypothetical protein
MRKWLLLFLVIVTAACRHADVRIVGVVPAQHS